MKVRLGGYNLDSTLIEELKALSPGRVDVTPETVSASYARISRDPRPIDELRLSARHEIERSRKSNQAIIFKLGHNSVAEHAVFNFDIIGSSRLSMEHIEHFRLVSFTEKSQRYITLTDDYVIPAEIAASKHLDSFISMIKIQNAFYHKAYDRLKDHVLKKHADLARDAKNASLLEGWAKEDARYITSLATQGQVGMTLNARNLELMIRRFASSQFDEIRQIGKLLYEETKAIAPSIIKYTEPRDYDLRTKANVQMSFKKAPVTKKTLEVELLEYTKGGDDVVVAAIIYGTTGAAMKDCTLMAKKMTKKQKTDVIKASMQYMDFFNNPLREFEYLDLTYDLVVSASCYAQLKRHRMSTQTVQDYDPKLGLTIPPAIIEVGLEKEFKGVIGRTEDLYAKMLKDIGQYAQYILTNAHRRRVLMGVNAREMYHLSRLREDAHAQWDIQNLTVKMTSLAKKKMPLTFMLIGGKDKFTDIREKVFRKA